MNIKRLLVINCFCLFVWLNAFKAQQIANYVSNGGFESVNSYSTTTLYNVPKYWQPIDTLKNSNYLASTDPAINNAPYALGFQYPRTGKNYVICSFLCSNCFSGNYREYLRNRLKQPLQAGKTYCAKYHIVNTNNSPLAIDSYGFYFGDATIDTINYCNTPLTYLTPQIVNINGIITDTLNWVAITGTFVATGNEKYMILGNFKTDAMTNTMVINPTFSTTLVNDVCIDDVSCIDIDLPAYAGPDIWGIPNNAVYLGRPQDVGIDEACMWYKLPNTITAIDTAAGITVTVGITTNTYIVSQEICGNIKWDTVVVHTSGLGLSPLSFGEGLGVRLYPNPANEILNIEFVTSSSEAYQDAYIQILNSLGQLVKEEEIVFTVVTLSGVEVKKALINTKELANGVYVLKISSVLSSPLLGDKRGAFSKRFVISR